MKEYIKRGHKVIIETEAGAGINFSDEDYLAAGAEIRGTAKEIFDESIQEYQPWYGMEQEFFLMTPQGKPIGFPSDGNPEKQGKYYCGVGTNNIFGREIIDEFYQHCIY